MLGMFCFQECHFVIAEVPPTIPGNWHRDKEMPKAQGEACSQLEDSPGDVEVFLPLSEPEEDAVWVPTLTRHQVTKRRQVTSHLLQWKFQKSE